MTQETIDTPAFAHGSSMSLAQYQRLVNRCASLRLDQSIANGSPRHAQILISKLFEVANHDVAIVSGALTNSVTGIDIYGDPTVIRNAKAFVENPAATLRIVLESGEIDGGEENRFAREVIDHPGRNAPVVMFRPKDMAFEPRLPHFMVCDREFYRVETKPDETEAYANFGDSNAATGLRDFFDEITEFISDTAKNGDAIRDQFDPGKVFRAA